MLKQHDLNFNDMVGVYPVRSLLAVSAQRNSGKGKIEIQVVIMFKSFGYARSW